MRKRVEQSTRHSPGGIRLAVAAILLCLSHVGVVSAQRHGIHYRHRANWPPGAVGREQLLRGGPLPGYFQPVRISGPTNSQIAIADEDRFSSSQPTPLSLGLLVGSVYRLKITQIPLHEGEEVYPTVEIINRLYPPTGSKNRFPIPVHISREELEFAISGRFVTRVIYLEDPESALPVVDRSRGERSFDVPADQDPLQIADQLGRPVAILRVGSRVPAQEGPDASFLFGSPPWEAISSAPEQTRPMVTNSAAVSRSLRLSGEPDTKLDLGPIFAAKRASRGGRR